MAAVSIGDEVVVISGRATARPYLVIDRKRERVIVEGAAFDEAIHKQGRS